MNLFVRKYVVFLSASVNLKCLQKNSKYINKTRMLALNLYPWLATLFELVKCIAIFFEPSETKTYRVCPNLE